LIRSAKLTPTYRGRKLALFNAAGYLEIAINKGNAAGLLGYRIFNQAGRDAYAE
jgi:S-adenosylmethionine hydrolase